MSSQYDDNRIASYYEHNAKGIVSLILPDECMPRICKSDTDPNGIPAEVILNPAAVVSRKNISQLYEAAMGKCIIKIFEIVKEKLEDKSSIEDIKKFLATFYGSKFDGFESKDYLKQYIEDKGIFGFRFEVGCYSKVSYEQIKAWMKTLDVSDSDYIYCPNVVIAETKDGLKGYPLESYKQQDDHTNIKKYELGWCEQQCITGNEYMLKLFHSADYSAKVTPTEIDQVEPIMGQGKYKPEGQSVGEMEAWTLMETGTEDFLIKQSNNMITSQYVFLSELLLAGYAILDKDGIPILSNYGQKLAKLRDLNKPKKE